MNKNKTDYDVFSDFLYPDSHLRHRLDRER